MGRKVIARCVWHEDNSISGVIFKAHLLTFLKGTLFLYPSFVFLNEFSIKL